MNNAKMWLVVKPSVGVPLLLAGVAVGSLLVHVGVVLHSSWYSDFVNGRDLGSSAATAQAPFDTGPTVASLLAK
ncbi:MAG: light-harvesting protein [Rubrimonas sp.]|uniref:light-harvesting protein n=1 Tax=Rubrimonas sp. TaxID=2036015 RepID=UPI002FDEBF5B